MKSQSVVFACAGILLFSSAFLLPNQDRQSSSAGPQYTRTGNLIRPQNYRQWIYLSSGFGMEYGNAGRGARMFTNVFVTPAAYRRFMATGKWPDRTIFVLEERVAASQGSINKSGHYQTGLAGLAASVKDTSRFSARWAYFSFRPGQAASAANARTACWECHNSHGAVDNTFVQFYPTLKKVAQTFGVYDETKAGGASKR